MLSGTRMGQPATDCAVKDRRKELGSAGGFGCFLGEPAVDRTPKMLPKSGRNANTGPYHNVAFGIGENEDLSVLNGDVACIVCSCVINLSTDKRRVFLRSFSSFKTGRPVGYFRCRCLGCNSTGNVRSSKLTDWLRGLNPNRRKCWSPQSVRTSVLH